MDKKMETACQPCFLNFRDLQFLAAGIDDRLRGEELATFSTHILGCPVCRDAVHDLHCILSASAFPAAPHGLATRILRTMGAGDRFARGRPGQGGELSGAGGAMITFSRKGD